MSPNYDEWSATCDTLHAHTQVLGSLAATLAPPEPQLQHAALRLTPRGWETAPLPAPDGSGALVVALDLHAHHAVAEHSDGRTRRVPLGPAPPGRPGHPRPSGSGRATLVGRVTIDPPSSGDALDDAAGPGRGAPHYARPGDGYSPRRPGRPGARRARAPYRGRSRPVNAWWGTFDLAVGLFSGLPAEPPSKGFIMRNSGDAQQIEVGGGRATAGTAVRPSSRMPARPRQGSTGPPWCRPRPLGRGAQGVRPRLGRRPGRG